MRSLFFALCAGLLLALFSYVMMQKAINQPLHLSEPEQLISVSEGSNLTRVTSELETAGIVQQPQWLLLYARLNNLTAIHAGEYQLKRGENGQNLLQKLSAGSVIQYQITFPEGLNLKEWLQRIAKHPKLSIDSQRTSKEILDQLHSKYPQENFEGWLFPDTYQFSGVDNVVDILSRAHIKMKKVLDEEWQKRAVGLPYKNAYEALIMASIVEKETGVPSERQQIAGVFVRRLQRGMRLQTDPTVIYGLGDRYQGNITRRHLKEKTPYNTYKIKGLPPTPIGMPGREAIFAALNPDDGEAIFFVAKGDGSHQFSRTLEEHTLAVKQYQLQRRQDYRSSPKE